MTYRFCRGVLLPIVVVVVATLLSRFVFRVIVVYRNCLFLLVGALFVIILGRPSCRAASANQLPKGSDQSVAAY
jgi:hypothetical protein